MQRRRRAKRIREIETEINELIRMRAKNLITTEEFLRQKKKLADQRIALESQTQKTTDIAQVRSRSRANRGTTVRASGDLESVPPPFRSRFDRLIFPAAS